MCLIGVVEGATGSGSRLGAGGGGALALTGAPGSTGRSPVVISIRATRPITTRISGSAARRPAEKDRTGTDTATADLEHDERGVQVRICSSSWRIRASGCSPSLAKVTRLVGDITENVGYESAQL